MTRFVPLALSFLTLLAGCKDHGPQPALLAAAAQAAQAGAPVAQTFTLAIDGVPVAMSPDAPRDGHVITASLVDGRNLNITAIDKEHDFMLGMNARAAGAGPIAPGALPSYLCRSALGCTEGEQGAAKSPESMLTRFPGTTPTVGDVKQAYLAPKVGLTPLTITLEKVEDAYWPGAGPSKRIKGTFSGTLAYVEEPRDAPPRIVGKTRKVEGSFDLYTLLR